MDESINNSDFFSAAGNFFDTSSLDLRTYSPLSFAFVGDAVFTLIIRTMVVARGNTKANRLHNTSNGYVNAVSQARMSEYIAYLLTEEEADILKRGKNTHINGHTRNASLYDYKCATGLETLFGYLYMSGQTQRLLTLAKACIEYIEKAE